MSSASLYSAVKPLLSRPAVFSKYTAADLWTDEHISKQMLACHLDGSIDVASYRKAFIEESANWICGRFAIGPGSKVADFGCGPGHFTTRFAERGAEVTGIDFSERSLEYARQLAESRDLEIRYLQCNYLEFESDERFDLIIMIMCDFSALSPVQRRKLLMIMEHHLKPGGYVLFDVHSLRFFEEIQEFSHIEENLMNGFWSPDPYVGILRVFKYEDEKVSLHKYAIIEENRTRVIYNWLQHFDVASLRNEFSESGLVVESILGNVKGDELSPQCREIAVVANKPRR